MLPQNKGTRPSSITGIWLSSAHGGFSRAARAPHASCWSPLEFRSDSILYSQGPRPWRGSEPERLCKVLHVQEALPEMGLPHRRKGGESLQMEPILGAAESSTFPVPHGQAAMVLSCLTISYLLLWGSRLRFSSDCTFLHGSSPARRPIPSNVGKAGGLKWGPRVACRMERKGGVPALLGYVRRGSGRGARSADSFLPDLSLAQTLTPGSRSCSTRGRF